MVESEQIGILVGRVVAMWPVAKNNAEYQSTLREMLEAKSSALTPDSLAEGYRALVANTKLSRADGGPAFPPNPHEVVGCCLAAVRNKAQGRDLPKRGLRKVKGRVCRNCQGPLNFMPGDDVLHCPACNAVMQIGESIKMEWSDIQRLDFADAPTITDEEVAEAKSRTLAALAAMKQKA
jgi:hypothetical protein